MTKRVVGLWALILPALSACTCASLGASGHADAPPSVASAAAQSVAAARQAAVAEAPWALDGGASVVRFVAVGDTGHGNEAQARVGAAIGAHCRAKGCDFVVLLGDNFYPTGVTSTSDPQWETAFVRPYASVLAPFYAILGNHDYGGFGSGNELEKGRHQVAYSKVNSRWRMPAGHYRFSLPGVADFFFTDTNRSMYAVDDLVRADLDAWLGTARAPWKVVFGHHPYYSNGRHGDAGRYDGVAAIPIANGAGVKDFLDAVVCGRADVYLSGHEHHMEWLEPTCGRPGSSTATELLISGAGSSSTGFAARPRHPDRWRGEGTGFFSAVVTSESFTGTFHGPDGEELFSRRLSKP